MDQQQFLQGLGQAAGTVSIVTTDRSRGRPDVTVSAMTSAPAVLSFANPTRGAVIKTLPHLQGTASDFSAWTQLGGFEMTLSIAARDQSTGQLGAAISSSSISVSSRCLHWQADVGVALSQNITDPRLGPRLLSLLADGVEVSAAINAVVQSTPHIKFRQLALLDHQGNTGLFTGDGVLGCFASAEGKNCVAAGNLLANESVPAAMTSAFEQSSDSFGSRLLGALIAGVEAGGEAGELRSAGMLIGGNPSWPIAELRIDWDQDPIAKMTAGWEVYEPQIDDYVKRAFDPQDAPSYGVPGDP